MRIDEVRTLFAAAIFAVSSPMIAVAQDNAQARIVPLAEFSQDELYAEGVSVENLLDSEVGGPTGEDIGEVVNVLFSKDGRVLSIIAEIGGFLEMGDTHVNVPWDQVTVAAAAEEVTVPVTQERIEEFTLFTNNVVTTQDSREIQEVTGDNLGVVQTGAKVWRATDLIGDIARLRDAEGDGFVNYGYVEDIVIRGNDITAVIVNPDVTVDAPAGAYALPYHDFEPGLGTYDLPYERAEVEALEPFDDKALDD